MKWATKNINNPIEQRGYVLIVAGKLWWGRSDAPCIKTQTHKEVKTHIGRTLGSIGEQHNNRRKFGKMDTDAKLVEHHLTQTQ
jgi:hypothetical protein